MRSGNYGDSQRDFLAIFYFQIKLCKEVEKMNFNIKGKLENYLELFQEIKKKISDERIALSMMQEISKDRRMEAIREEREIKECRCCYC